MEKSIIVGLLQNTAILLSISMIYDYWWIKESENNPFKKILTGLIIGVIGIVLMMTPWIMIPGIVFDTRSVVLSVAGLFFGAVPTLISMLLMGLFRLFIGGDGVIMGIAVIVSSGTIGILWNIFRPLRKSKKYVLELVLMGFVVHVVMLACTVFLPEGQGIITLKTVFFPVIFIYPLATVLLGILLYRHLRNWQNRQASEKLTESERRFSEMLKNTKLFSIILDGEGKIIFANQAILDNTGYSHKEVFGKYFFENFVDGESGTELKKNYKKFLEGNESLLNYEVLIICKNGSELLVSWNNTIFRDINGSVSGMASIGENITKRKQAEKELIDAKLKAEESDMLKSIFLANMSHEIRTPMNSIMGFSSLLAGNDIDETEKAQYIDIIKSSGSRLLQLINDIIDLSKLEAKQLHITYGECSLWEVMNTSLETFKQSDLLLKKPGIDLTSNFQESLHKIMFLSDCIRVEQVLDNLISNAIKYTEKGSIEIGCSVKTKEGKEVIEFYVKDTGAGIPKEIGDVIFERFRQVEENKYHEGAGLGLSISKGIATLLGGKLWFTSEINKGSTFYFTIPYIIPETHNVKPQVLRDEFPGLSGKTIIIAEDDYTSFLYLQFLLNNQKANILHAKNGIELLEMVQKKIPDLVLLDINMPGITGFEFLTQIHLEGLKMKIIAQTAYAMPFERERCLSAGCNGYIAKPIKRDELFKVINSVMSV